MITATLTNSTLRQSRLLDAMRAQPGEWTAHQVMSLYRASGVAPGRTTARGDLKALTSRGALTQSDRHGRRFFTLNNNSSPYMEGQHPGLRYAAEKCGDRWAVRDTIAGLWMGFDADQATAGRRAAELAAADLMGDAARYRWEQRREDGQLYDYGHGDVSLLAGMLTYNYCEEGAGTTYETHGRHRIVIRYADGDTTTLHPVMHPGIGRHPAAGTNQQGAALMSTRPRDPDCECLIQFPGARRIWCEHCLTEGPLPGSLADPTPTEPPSAVTRRPGPPSSKETSA